MQLHLTYHLWIQSTSLQSILHYSEKELNTFCVFGNVQLWSEIGRWPTVNSIVTDFKLVIVLVYYFL